MTFKELCESLIGNWDLPIPMENQIRVYVDGRSEPDIWYYDFHAISKCSKDFERFYDFSVYEIKWIIDKSIFIAKIRKEDPEE